MTTSTTILRAAASAVVAALLVVLATPTAAFASRLSVAAGPVTVKDTAVETTATVTNLAPKANNVRITVSATGGAANFVDVAVANGQGCTGSGATVSCGKMDVGQSKNFKVTVTPKGGLKEGQTKSGHLQFKVEGPNSGGGNGILTVEGYTQTSPGIEGTVTDIDGDKPLEGVKITAKDDQGKTYGPVTTGSDGKFSIPGEVPAGAVVTWTATKDKYEEQKGDTAAVPGQMVVIEPRMEKKDSGKSQPPDKEPNDVGTDDAPDESGFTLTTWLLIILGVLLVAGGVVAIWMLLRKGRNEDEDDFEALPNEPPTHQFSASQTGRLGIYEASNPRPGMDNPTMIHQGPLVNDEDLARYGSEPPSSGFGPAYGEARPTQVVDPSRGEPQSGATRMYPASGHEPHHEPPSSGGRRYREEWGSGYDDQQSRNSYGRHYRESGYDDYDDRPRSW